MKNYSLRFIAFGLLCALVVSTSVRSCIEPKHPAVTNTTWGQALKKSGTEGVSHALFWLQYFKIPSLAFNYAVPTWGISKFWNKLGNTEETAHGLAVSCALTAISLRYKKQIVESCEDEETTEALLGVAPLVGFLLPTKLSCLAGLALVAALHKKEWSSKNSKPVKPVIRWT